MVLEADAQRVGVVRFVAVALIDIANATADALTKRWNDTA
jgi:hypothetical protein